MRADEVEKGMLVRLKSGGPQMTVRVVSGTQAYCEWFTDVDRRQGTFDVWTLQAVAPGDAPTSPPAENSQA